MANTLKNRAYEYLRRGIFAGEIAPGTQIISTELARELGMSMIPVREAIQQLAGDGLIEQRPHVGSFVRRLDAEEMEELMRFRAGLDCMAASEAARRAMPEHLAGMEQACAELREAAREARKLGPRASVEQLLPIWLRVNEADYSLHMWIVRASGNRYLLKSYRDHQVISRAMRSVRFLVAMNAPRVLARLYAGHARIYRAIRRRDSKLALERMQFHWSVDRGGVDPLRPHVSQPGMIALDLPIEHQWIYRRVEEIERGH